MVNRYDTPAQARFINTYSPLPFQEMLMAGEARQKRYDDTLAKLDAFQSNVDNLKAIANSSDYAKLEKLRTSAQALSNEFIDKDLSDVTISNDLTSRARKLFDANEINRIQDSYAAWANNQKYIAELKSKGLYSDVLDQIDPANKYYDSALSGVYNYKTEALLDYRKKGQQYFDPLHESSRFDPKTGMIYSGIYDSDINRTSNESLSSFLDTNEGIQAVKIALGGPEAYNKATTEQKRAAALTILKDIGEPYKRSHEEPMAGWAGLYGNKDNNGSGWTNTTENSPSIRVSNLKELTLPNASNEGTPSTSLSYGYGPSFTSKRFNTNDDKILIENSNRTKEIEATRNKYSKYNSSLSNMSDEDFVKLYNSAINGINNQSIQYIGIPDDDVKTVIKNEIAGWMNNKNFTIIDQEGKPNDFQKLDKRAFKMIGVSNYEELKEAIIKAPQVSITQDYKEPGMYAIEISGSGKYKKPVTLLIGSNTNVQGIFKNSNLILQSMRNLNDTPIPLENIPGTNNYVGIQVVPILNNEKSKFDFDLIEGIFDENGMFNPIGQYDGGLSRLKQMELNNLKSSTLTGSNINHLHQQKNSSPFE